MPVDQALVEAAKEQAVARFPEGEGGAAAIYLSDGSIITSVGFDSPNEAANLCYEAGAYCEAFRLGKSVTASVCVVRESSERPFTVIAPCGICQERLSIWRDSVEVAGKLGDRPRFLVQLRVDSGSNRNTPVPRKHLTWRSVVETFSRSMIESITGVRP